MFTAMQMAKIESFCRGLDRICGLLVNPVGLKYKLKHE